MTFYTVLRAAFGYLFLVLMVRIVGRRPGKQLTPFEFVLVFYLGGLTLTGIVGTEMSLTNAFCQIMTIALCHYALAWLRFHYHPFARILDGTPLILMEKGHWRSRTMSHMRLQDDDAGWRYASGVGDSLGILVLILRLFVPESPRWLMLRGHEENAGKIVQI